MKIKKLICWIKAIPVYLRSGQWGPHLYACDYQKVIIIADEKNFRVSDNYEHKPGEQVYKNACLITGTCVRCGHKTTAWYHSWDERWRLG